MVVWSYMSTTKQNLIHALDLGMIDFFQYLELWRLTEGEVFESQELEKLRSKNKKPVEDESTGQTKNDD